MKIKSLTIKPLEIPFKVAFTHSSASRSQTAGVLVTAESQNGLTGYGEGCPRNYVTGEDMDSVMAFFEKHKHELQGIGDLEQLRNWINKHEKIIDTNPAAWCAVELALLDLLGKVTNQSVESLLSLPELAGEFHYTAVLGTSSLPSFQKQLGQYAHLGFTDFKIKVSGNIDEDKSKVNAFNALSNEIRVRLDANNLWDETQESINYIKELDFPFFAIEEPLQANDYEGCRRIFEELGIRIILDESLLRLEQFSEIENFPDAWIINLRISKMGGVLRSLALAEQAKKTGIAVIIGAQVGETSILTRAALTIANCNRDILLAQEGAFGTHLLEHDITGRPIMFGKGGNLKADELDVRQPGWGISIYGK